MPEKDQIAAQLPQFRMKNMKFQSELAAESHVCEKTIRSLEKANANPRLKTLKRIVSNFGMSVSAFLRLDPSPSLVVELSPNYEEDDFANITDELFTLSCWLKVFLSFSGETQQDFSTILAFASIQLTDSYAICPLAIQGFLLCRILQLICPLQFPNFWTRP